eukprot:4933683-Prymnesium_polylepis.1
MWTERSAADMACVVWSVRVFLFFELFSDTSFFEASRPFLPMDNEEDDSVRHRTKKTRTIQYSDDGYDDSNDYDGDDSSSSSKDVRRLYKQTSLVSLLSLSAP